MNPEQVQFKNKFPAKGFIFLAEDDTDDIELLTESLQNLDQVPEIQVIKSGQRTVSFLEALPDNHLPGLIILDYNLPEMNGHQILSILATIERYRHVPKIVWSTSNSPLYEKECLGSGASAYYVKPSDFSGFQSFAKRICSLIR